MEHVTIIEKVREDSYKIIGDVERDYAHDNNLSHVTVIGVPFVYDGDSPEIILHNNYFKAVAKLKHRKDITEEERIKKLAKLPKISLNVAPAGHCCPDDSLEYVTESFLFENLRKEMSEECYVKTDKDNPQAVKLEKWEYAEKEYARPIGGAEGYEYGVPYDCPLFVPIPIGFAEHKADGNVEHSYVFALPFSTEEYNSLLLADDVDGLEHHLLLPHEKCPISELKDDGSLLDAITRLFFNPDNKKVLDRLMEVIDEYCKRKKKV
ncbi:MAG: hypothetical protein LBD23_20365 [Oscillospiraceae bacterium]|jgi:hypothetical protein|nr:hypothetical protein [Oscillospiraceae bacterium]